MTCVGLTLPDDSCFQLFRTMSGYNSDVLKNKVAPILSLPKNDKYTTALKVRALYHLLSHSFSLYFYFL